MRVAVAALECLVKKMDNKRITLFMKLPMKASSVPNMLDQVSNAITISIQDRKLRMAIRVQRPAIRNKG
jgi:hypothetical protein